MKNNKKKDILFLCQFFYPEYISSATLPFDTAKALVKAGNEVDVMCGYPKEYSKVKNVPINEKIEGINIKRLKYIQLKRSSTIGRLINYFSFTLSVCLNIMKFKNYKSVIVYSNPPILPVVALISNIIFGTKIIFVGYDIYPEIAIETNTVSKGSLISKAMSMINTFLYRRVSKVVALSEDMKMYLLNNRLSITEEKIDVIPNWYEDKINEVTQESISNNLIKDINSKYSLVVSYFGNMGIAQELDTLIASIRSMKDDNDVAFMFAGHGVKLEFIRELKLKEKLENVYIFDFLHNQDFQEALHISDVFVVSLDPRLTGLAVPSKTYSYLMSGKPILSVMDRNTDIAKDIRQFNAGYSIDAGDSLSMIEAIEELKNNLETRKLFGKNSRNLFLEKYTILKSTSKYINLMNKVLEEK